MKNHPRTYEARLREDLRDPEFKKAFDEEEIPARLALEIARLRQKQGLTQKALAKKLHVTQQALSLLEDPLSAHFTIRTLQKVATALNRKLVVQLR